MKQITILLSSVLTLLLITGNNAYAAPHYTDFGGKFQGKKPDMNSGGRFMPKRNSLGDDISGYGYKNILKKGNVFKGNVRLLPNRNSGGRFNPISKYSISDEPAFIPKPAKMHDSIHCVNPSNCLDKPSSKFGGQEGEAFNPTSKYSISDEPAFIPKPDGALGPDVVTTLEHGPGIWSTGGAHALEQPKGVQLEFINGKWVEPLANVDLQNVTDPSPMD